ncbi:MAG: hypothetical protein D5S00_05595 [Tindallia sp. MSAO_Bac2]|nr:MAG: hypothetical protein D5S00_05595 [Tindallia sp. MSAO_Bac2]
MVMIDESALAPCIVHEKLNEQTLELMIWNGNRKLALQMRQYLPLINQGSRWVDQGFRNMHHFFHPIHKKGLPGCSNAQDEIRKFTKQIRKAGRSQNLRMFYFSLGAILHLTQDMCVPHHIFGKLLQGHHTYEKWVQDHFESFPVKSFQKNLPEMTAEEILINNAQNGLDFEGLMYGEMKEREMLMATTELLQQARVSGIQLFRCYAAESLEMATEGREQGALTIPKTA